MTFHHRPAVRESTFVLLGLAGSTGSGKTYSALKLATGMAGGKKFGFVDTENGRGLHYADDFDFEYGELREPFTPKAYAEAIKTYAKDGFDVIVIDSASHEHAGDGGLLDWHDAELDRMAGDDWKKRDTMNLAAWVKPKMSHKKDLVNTLLSVRAHVILCFRAEEKIEIVKNQSTGKMEVIPKRAPGRGVEGWVPIAEKNLPYEMTASFLLTAEKPGVPHPIKLEKQHKPFVDLSAPLDESVGEKLAKWAAGGKKAAGVSKEEHSAPAAGALSIEAIEKNVLKMADELGAGEAAKLSVADKKENLTPAKYAAWIKRQHETLEKAKEDAAA